MSGAIPVEKSISLKGKCVSCMSGHKLFVVVHRAPSVVHKWNFIVANIKKVKTCTYTEQLVEGTSYHRLE